VSLASLPTLTRKVIYPCQVHAAKIVLVGIWFVLCRQPRFTSAPGGLVAGISVWYDHQGTVGGGIVANPPSDCHRRQKQCCWGGLFRQFVLSLIIETDRSLIPCQERYFHKIVNRVNFDIGAKLSNFLATGNLVSQSGLDLQQASGFTIVAEKLNWQRYISHFRCIHRGAFFAELKTTTVRKLLPEAWGSFSP
jgi:hypothetical protein